MSDYFDIILNKYGENPNDTLQLIKEISGKPIEEIERKTIKLPVVIHTVFTAEDAYCIRKRFEEIGAEVKIKGMSFEESDNSLSGGNSIETRGEAVLSDWQKFKKNIKYIRKI